MLIENKLFSSHTKWLRMYLAFWKHQSPKEGHIFGCVWLTCDLYLLCFVWLGATERKKMESLTGKAGCEWVCVPRSSEALLPQRREQKSDFRVSSGCHLVRAEGNVAVSDGNDCRSLRRCKDGVWKWQQVPSTFCWLTSYSRVDIQEQPPHCKTYLKCIMPL